MISATFPLEPPTSAKLGANAVKRAGQRVALQMFQPVARRGGPLLQVTVDGRQRGVAVLVGLALTQKVQIGPVEYEDASQDVYP